MILYMSYFMITLLLYCCCYHAIFICFYCYTVKLIKCSTAILLFYCYRNNAITIMLLLQCYYGNNHTPPNLQSQGFGSIATPAFMFIVVCSAVGFTGVANPKAALQSKASAAQPSGISCILFVMGQLTILTTTHNPLILPTPSHALPLTCVVVYWIFLEGR